MPQPRKHNTALFFSILISILFFPFQLNADTPDILVTLKPVHSLVSALMLDVGEAELLMDNFQSPHDYSMRPSDRRRINQADIIIYVSPDIEGFMPAIHSSLKNKKLIRLIDIPGLKLLDARAFDSHTKGNRHHNDGHIWLSIDNAIIISQYLAEILIKRDANNHQKYRTNRDTLIFQLKQLKADIQEKMQTLHNQPFLTFHDAFQYFEHEFELTSGHFVTTSPDQKAGIRHITFLQKKIQQLDIHCVFYEPPHIPKIIKTITEGSQIHLIPLEPLGIKYAAGEKHYFKLLNDISNNLYKCMKQDL